MHTRQRTVGGETYGQGDAIVELGLGTELPARVDVTWPSGLAQRVDELPGLAADAEVRIVEPAWLVLSARTAAAADPAPVLTYTAVGADGAPLGVMGAGRAVSVTRSDGVGATVVDHGDGSYTATLPHLGAPGRTTLTIEIDGQVARHHPMISYW